MDVAGVSKYQLMTGRIRWRLYLWRFWRCKRKTDQHPLHFLGIAEKSGGRTVDWSSQWQNLPNLKSGCSGVLIHVWYCEETILWLVEMTQQNRVPLPTSNCRARWWRGCQGVKRNLAITQPPPKLNVWFATDVFQAASTGSPGVCSRFYP